MSWLRPVSWVVHVLLLVLYELAGCRASVARTHYFGHQQRAQPQENARASCSTGVVLDITGKQHPNVNCPGPRHSVALMPLAGCCAAHAGSLVLTGIQLAA